MILNKSHTVFTNVKLCSLLLLIFLVSITICLNNATVQINLNCVYKCSRNISFADIWGHLTVLLPQMLFTVVKSPWVNWARCGDSLHSCLAFYILCQTQNPAAQWWTCHSWFLRSQRPGKWDVWQANHVYQSIVPPRVEGTRCAVRNISLFIFVWKGWPKGRWKNIYSLPAVTTLPYQKKKSISCAL